jgi:transforming growth factor-beta-induced protein
MKINKMIKVAALSLFINASLASAKEKDIIDTAVGAGNFKTLAAALKAAGLVDTLKGSGPFTVFAPTDQAFAKLPDGTVENLLKPENKKQLIDILTYHVVSGKVPSKVAVTLNKATALNKKTIKLKVKGKSLFLNESKVSKADIECSNGVIHVIDAVLLPPKRSPKKAMKTGAGRDLIGLAIMKGAPLYNHGNHHACAAVYEVVAHALMAMPESAVSIKDRRMLEHAITSASKSQCMTSNAWTYRSAFDRIMVATK